MNHSKSIISLRREYKLNKLSEENVHKSPLKQFSKWFEDALNARLYEPNAMVLATVDKTYKPSARVVLMKNFDEAGISFYTNYNSRKGSELLLNPKASLLFFWAELERQVRIEGRVKKLSKKISEIYFNSRPFESRISALVSRQSKKVFDRSSLEKKFNELKEKYSDGKVPMPENWGGYILVPNYYEFWQGRDSRLHDRVVYKLKKQEWKIYRLAP